MYSFSIGDIPNAQAQKIKMFFILLCVYVDTRNVHQ